MTVYLGLDINGAIGSILQVAVMMVIPFTILGQVLARTGGVGFFLRYFDGSHGPISAAAPPKSPLLARRCSA